MAEQESFIKLKGSVGDISFRKTKKGYTAYQKAKINPNTLLTGKGSKHMRNLKQEFSRAASQSKLLRDVIRPVIKWCKSKTHVSRLTAAILKTIREDQLRPEGERLITQEGCFHLIGFEFNERVNFNQIILEPLATAVDFSTNKASLTIPDSIITEMFSLPELATGFKFVLCVAICDFDNNVSNMSYKKTDMLDPQQEMLASTELILDIPSNDSGYAITMVGIEFYRSVNGFEERLYDGAADAIQIVNVEEV